MGKTGINKNPPALYYSEKMYDKLISTINDGLVLEGKKVIDLSHKQKEVIITLLSSQKDVDMINRIGHKVMALQNHIDLYGEQHIEDIKVRIKGIKKTLLSILQSEEFTEIEKDLTSREVKVKYYYAIEFSKGNFSFKTLSDVPELHKELFEVKRGMRGKWKIKPNYEIAELLFSDNDEVLNKLIYKIGVLYQLLEEKIDEFSRITTSSTIYGLPQITNRRDFYLHAGIYSWLYNEAKKNEEILEDFDEQRQRIIDGILNQMRLAYKRNDYKMIQEVNETIKKLKGDTEWLFITQNLETIKHIYLQQSKHILTIKDMYDGNEYYTTKIVKKADGERIYHEQTIELESNILLQDELWFFQHKKFKKNKQKREEIVHDIHKLNTYEKKLVAYLSTISK